MNRYRSMRREGFTIIEVMIAIAIFAMIIAAIYMVWLSILKGSNAALKAAAEVQRSRIAMHTLEDAFLTIQLFQRNMDYYAFLADSSGELSAVSMVARLPASFPGVGRYGDQVVRRVSFQVTPGRNGQNELLMTQAPMLMETNSLYEPYSLVLARDVTEFLLEYWDSQIGDWDTKWDYTNALPKLVKITLGLGTRGNSSQPHDEVSKVVAIPGAVVPAELQGGPQQQRPGMTNQPPVTQGQQPVLNNVPGAQNQSQPGFQQPRFQGGRFQ